ncbi:MAG: DUF308 domain-containing protein [Eubacteriales bacterium]|nr:DUF308 domain-containing protein [Eubacteriales bacterium]
MESIRILKIAKNGYIIMSVLFCLLGAWLIVFPGCSAKVFCILVGVLLILDGIIKIIGYFSKDSYCLAFQFDLAFGILIIAIGAVVIIRSEVMTSLFFAVFGVIILADALFKIQMSIDARKFGLGMWWRILIVAIVTGVFGTILLVKPFEGARIMMILAGISILLEGILNLCVAVYTVKLIKKQSSSYIDDYC